MNHNNICRSGTNNAVYFGCPDNLEEAYRAFLDVGHDIKLSEFVYGFHPQFEFSVGDFVEFDSDPRHIFRVRIVDRSRMVIVDSKGKTSTCNVNTSMPRMADIPKEIYEMARADVFEELRSKNVIL